MFSIEYVIIDIVLLENKLFKFEFSASGKIKVLFDTSIFILILVLSQIAII